MNKVEVFIQSYFSIDTDLASSFRDWPEFVEGSGYEVSLSSPDGSSVKITQSYQDEIPYISVSANSDNQLFQKALGLSTYLLAKHSDNLLIQRRS